MRLARFHYHTSFLLAAALLGVGTAVHAQAKTVAPRHPVPPLQKPNPDASIVHPFVSHVPAPAPAYREIKKSDGTTDWVLRPLHDGTPAPKDPAGASDHVRRISEEIFDYLEPPMALVSRTFSAVIYSRNINRPLCVARGGDRTWIGTAIGVKCVDNRTKTVRIFSITDGLPGGQVENIDTDSSGANAVALVRQADNRTNVDTSSDRLQAQLAVCLYESSTKRWKILGSVPAPHNLYLVADALRNRTLNKIYPATSYVVLAPDRVGVFFGGETTDTNPSFVSYDRATGKSQTVAWDESIQADFSAVTIHAVCWKAGRFCLGTDLGLLCYDTKTQIWQRLLPAHDILQIASDSRDSDSLVVLSRPRYQKQSVATGVATVSLNTGKILGVPLTLPIGNTANAVLSLAPDGTPWLTSRDAFYAATPGRQGWRTVGDDGKDIPLAEAANPPRDTRGDSDSYYLTTLPTVADANQIPDSALIPRLLIPVDPFLANHSYLVRNYFMHWMRQRFPAWISPTSSALKQADWFSAHNYSYGCFSVDSEDSHIAWGVQNGKLFRLPADAIPSIIPKYDYLSLDSAPSFLTAYAPHTALVATQSFDLFNPASAQKGDSVPIPIFTLTSIPDADDSLYVVSANGVKRYDAGTGTWTAYSVFKGMYHGYGGDRVITTADGSHLLLKTSNTLYRLRPGTTSFEPIYKRERASVTRITPRGLWNNPWRESTFEYLPITADGTPQGDWQTLSAKPDLPELKDATRDDNFFEVTGSVAWFHYLLTKSRDPVGETMLVGYDVARKEWLVPMKLTSSNKSITTYLTTSNANGTRVTTPPLYVYAFQPGSEGLQQISDTRQFLRADTSFRVAEAADGTLYVVTPGTVGIYNPTEKKWSFVALPGALSSKAENSYLFDNIQITATNKGAYIGRDISGVWRLDRSDASWRQVQEPIRWAMDDSLGSRYYLEGTAADTSAVWAFGRGNYNAIPTIIRWDRQSKQASFVTAKETTIPFYPRDTISMVSAGNTVLLMRACLGQRSDSGVYRAVPNTTRFQRISNTTVTEAKNDPKNPGTVFWISGDVLYRYEERTQQITKFDPKLARVEVKSPGSDPEQYTNYERTLKHLVVTDTAVYAGTSSGVFRFDRQKETWSMVDNTESLNVEIMQREANTLTITAPNTILKVTL